MQFSEEVAQLVESPQIPKARPRYGRIIVLFQRKPWLISLGPDYPCFIATFITMSALGFLLCTVASNNFTDQNMIAFAYTSSLLQCGLYLLVALSNPCVALKQNNLHEICEQNSFLFCDRCGAEKKARTYHCPECDVCIEGYDHHCPFISKCIGKGNCCFFYSFLVSIPFYLITFISLMMLGLALYESQGRPKPS